MLFPNLVKMTSQSGKSSFPSGEVSHRIKITANLGGFSLPSTTIMGVPASGLCGLCGTYGEEVFSEDALALRKKGVWVRHIQRKMILHNLL